MTKDIKSYLNHKSIRQFFLIIILFHILFYTGFSQKGAVFNLRLSSLSDSIVWVQEVVNNENNGYLVTGMAGSLNRATTFVARLDCSGDVLWAKKNADYDFSFKYFGHDQLYYFPLYLIGYQLFSVPILSYPIPNLTAK